MTHDPIHVNYTPLTQSAGTPPRPPSQKSVPRYCSAKVIMLGLGVTGATVLIALLIVFLAPGKAQAQADSDPGANYTSPPYYPARMQHLFSKRAHHSDCRWVRGLGQRVYQSKGARRANDHPGKSKISHYSSH